MSDHLEAMRHSLAHIMATAVLNIWPDAKLGVGPAIEHGFYYDIDLGEDTISEEDFPKIEAEMRKVIAADQHFEQFEKSIDDAIKWAKDNNQPYKEELLNDLKRAGTTVAKDLDPEELGTISDGSGKGAKTVSFYRNGDFTDLCRGPHVDSTGRVGAFKLYKVSGAYWRGDENRQMMQRLYGAAFKTQEELDKFFKNLDEAKLRDHRRLGRELELFTTSDLVGSGLPLFLPKGAALRDLLSRYSLQLRRNLGYQEVWIPHITKRDLYEKSGHWAKFGDELFLVTSQETTDEMVLKPMNCPHHTQIYAAKPRSYKELPLKFMENTTTYRDEKSGELHGLSRVRSITMDDNHAFVREDQIEEVVDELVSAAKAFYSQLDMKLRFRLSFRDDSDGYLGEPALWDKAQATLKKFAEKNDLDYFIEEGEAAFYGPKIDFIAEDALERIWQVATVQVDFVQPKRFELEYVDKDGSAKTPVMIHAALMGSIERFLSVYIEHTAGDFPFWLAPEQVRVVTVNDAVGGYVKDIQKSLEGFFLNKPLTFNELRLSVDDRNESLGKKIRDAEMDKVPVILVVGPKDEAAKQVSARINNKEVTIKLDDLRDYLSGL